MTKFFVTGGTGFIGSALVDELLSHGYHILALARSDKSEEELLRKGAEVLRGDLEDLETIKKGAQETDGTLHLGFIRDHENFTRSTEVDQNVTTTIIKSLRGTGKLFIYTTGLGVLTTEIGIKSYETDRILPDRAPKTIRKRIETEGLVLDASNMNVKSIVIRLASAVHGSGDPGIISQLFNIANHKKVSQYVDSGINTWPAIHRKDAARLYRLAAEKGLAGRVYHAIHEEGIETKRIAKVIAKKLGLRTKKLGIEEATDGLGFVGYFLGININCSSKRTKEELDWIPKENGLLQDIMKNYSV